MVKSGYVHGLGVEENTAAIVRGTSAEIVGAGGALYVNLARAKIDDDAGAFNLRGARLSYLDRGDRIDLATGAITPSPAKLADTKLDWQAADFRPSRDAARLQLDIPASNSVSTRATGRSRGTRTRTESTPIRSGTCTST